MAVSANDIRVYYSGGASNTTPTLCLGGIISTTTIDSQSASWGTGSIAGVSLVEGIGVTESACTGGSDCHLLRFDYSAQTLEFKEFGDGGYGYPIDVSSDGTYIIPNTHNDSFLRATVTAASLPVADATETVNVTNDTQNLFPNVSESDSDSGLEEYLCVYLKNNNATDAASIYLHFVEYPTTGSGVYLGLESTSGQAQTIANRFAAPTNVTFNRYVGSDNELGFSLDSSEYWGVWIKRTVPIKNPFSHVEAQYSIKIRIIS